MSAAFVPSWKRAAAALALMLGAVVLAQAFTPRARLAALSSDLKLETAIPRAFAGWRVDNGTVAQVINPQQVALLNTLYAQTLTRTYVGPAGERVMLSIAYGAAQAGELELHRPEVCYVAQGFQIRGGGHAAVQADATRVPVQRLLASLGPRSEPISYWMRVGDDVIPSGMQQQVSRLKQGMRGWIPDGLLFRVSTIASDTAPAYAMQERFMADLLQSVDPRTRRFLIGPVSPSHSPADASVAATAP
jgi:EpsI family protein